MNCTLDRSDYKNLFGFAHAALTDSKNANQPFDLQAEVQQLYDDFKDDPAYALGLVQAYPSQLYMALGHTRELSKYHRKNGLSTDSLIDLADEFENLETVQKYLGPSTVAKEAKADIDESIEAENKQPATPTKQSPDQILNQTNELDKWIDEFMFKTLTGLSTTGQQALLDAKGEWTQEKNPEVDFYYNFFHKFQEEFWGPQDGSKVTINGHTGFRLKVLSKTKIDIEDAKPYDQRLVQGAEGYPVSRGEAIYHGGIAAAVTNNKGEVLYFDENYNVVGKDGGGKPIYHSVRFITKENEIYSSDTAVQDVAEMAKNMGIDPAEAFRLQQDQFKILYDIRKHVNSKRKENSILLDINNVSRGVLNIRKNLPADIDTKINDINWDKSDIKPTIKIAKRTSPEVGEVEGGAYIAIPGHRSIPIQPANLSEDDINKVLDLILNDEIIDSKTKDPVTAGVKVKLIENIILTNGNSLQVIDRKGKFIALFKGKAITPDMRADIKEFLNTKYVSKEGRDTEYNTTNGQYAYKEPASGQKFEEFDIKNGMLIRRPMDLAQHIANNGSLKIIPNEVNGEKVISFLNGYMTFDVANTDRKKIGLADRTAAPVEEVKAEAAPEFHRGLPIIETDDIKNAEGHKGAAQYSSQKKEIRVNRPLLKKKYKEKAWTKMRNLIETIDGKKITSKAKDLPADQFESYEQFEQFVIEHEYQHSQLTRKEFEKTNPGSTKGEYETEINERALFSVINLGLPEDAGNIETAQPEVKDKEFTKVKIETNDDGLAMNRVIKMKATPEQIAAAKEWFDSSPLSKHIKYEELFNVVNSNAWAHFVDGGIKLYAGSDYTVLYHEAFHAFTQHFLSKEEKVKLYNETSNLPEGKKAIKAWAKQKGVSVDKLSQYQKYLAIEELLAEDFRQYALSDGNKVFGKTPERNSFFRRLLNFLRELLGGKIKQNQIATDRTLLNVEEVYAKLYIGNINNYRPSVKNAMFTEALASTIQPVEGETITLDDQDALLIVQSIDGIISSYIDQRNKVLQINSPGDTRYTSAIFTNPEKHLTEVYQAAYNAFIDKLQEVKDELVKNPEDQKLLQQKTLLTDTLTNFGDPLNPIKGGGVLAYHMKKSPYMSAHIKNLDREAFEKTEADVAATRHDRKGNELSKMELASNRVSYLINSIRKYDKDGNEETNELGFPILMEFNETFGKIASIIGEQNNTPAEIRSALLRAASENPWTDALVRKLGPTNSPHHSVNDLWTGFWATFYLSNQRLHETMINETTKDGVRTYEVLTGYASAVFRQVERDFRSHFKISNHPNEFIVDSMMGNFLNTKAVLDKYRGKLYKREFEFLRDIGIPLTDNAAIRAGLGEVGVNVGFIFDKLDALNAKGVAILDVIQTLRDPFTFKAGDKEISLKSETSNVNKILSLEAKHSGNYANASVLTSTGNVAYENSMMSSMAVQVKALNSVDSFQELIAIPYMSYLDYKNNPAITGSNRLKALFEFDENTKTFGARRKDVTISIDNLDGTQNIVEDTYMDRDYSMASAKADKYTRLMQDVYSLFLEGKPSSITPGDKSTILSTYVNTLYTEGSDKHLYVDLGSFGKKGGQVNLGVEQAYNLLLPYLEAELQRMADVARHQESPFLPNVEGYTSPDKDGNISGLDFSTFKGMFQEETKAKLLDAFKKIGSGPLRDSLADVISPTLRSNMLKDLNHYFTWSANETRKTLGRMLYIDQNLADLTSKGVGETVTGKELNDIIMKAYVVNKFIHGLEDSVLFYGDLGQYKDLDKRGSALNATGRMFRTDADAQDYVNKILKRPFAEKQGMNGYKEFDGSLDTAIFAEDVMPSVMVPEYRKRLTKEIGARVKNEAEVKKIVDRILKPYLKMETGDAQGWISFDSYRILAKLENRWSDQQEALYQQILTDPDNVKLKDIAEYFPARKYQYFGPLAAQGIHATAFHKFSLFPLIPTVVKNRKLNELHENMMKQGIDYATFKTGSKVGTIVAEGTTGGDQLYNKDGSVATDVQYTKNTIYLNYLKDQLDINAEFKGKVIFSTQLRKLIEEGLVEGGVPVDFKPAVKNLDSRIAEWDTLDSEAAKEKASPFYKLYKTYENKIEKLIEFRKAELRAEIGSTEEELAEGKGDLSKLVRFIQRELDRQDLADHEIDFIQEVNGKLVRDLSISPSAAKIERALNAIVNNRLIRQKVNGESLVQVANSMWEPTASSAEEKESWGTKDLKTYREGSDGRTLGMDVKIALQGNFEKLIHIQHADGKKVAVYTKKKVENADGSVRYVKEFNEAATLTRLNETIKDPKWRAVQSNIDMITMVGVRIPVQGLNSMEFMVVQEFLPEAAGNIIVPPAEIVAKSGSDFDIDKLTVMMPGISIIAGKPEIISEAKGKGAQADVKRIEAIQEELKKLREKKGVLQDENTKKFKEAIGKNLSVEDKAEMKLIHEYFDDQVKGLKKQIREHGDTVSRMEKLNSLTDDQMVILGQAWAALNNLSNEVDAWEQERKETIAATFSDIRQENIDAIDSKELKSVLDKMAKLNKEKDSISGQAIENTLMFSIRDILELPHNFVSLITPNDTSLVKPLADELSKKREYSELDGAWGKTESRDATRYLEPAYNIYKHESNAVGKETLGLGAIDNTYNTVFNRIGAYMNPEYLKGEKKKLRRATMLLDHNTRAITEGVEGISLSHLYDVNGVNKIADVINQLMNGWVDVAKDAWIFDIQGNKQVTPTLMFLIQSGVPFETAVYFVSNPLVVDYVKEQQIATSAFAKATNNNPAMITFYRDKAKVNIFRKIGLGNKLVTLNKAGQEIVKDDALYKETLKRTEGKNFDQELMHDITNGIAKKSDEVAAFLHYLELEEMAKGVSNLKLKLNYDTSRSTTLFDAQKSEADLTELMNETLFPQEIVEAILDESPVGSFRIAPFQLELWGPLFNIRNRDALSDFLIGKLREIKNVKIMEKVYGSAEKFVEEFKNDVVVKIFTDGIKNYNIKDSTYKGLPIDKEVGSLPIEHVKHLNRGVMFHPETGKIYIDKATLDMQFDKDLYTADYKASTPIVNEAIKDLRYDALGLARVPVEAFKFAENSKQEFYHFSIEREYQRGLHPFSELSKTKYFKFRYEKNVKKYRGVIPLEGEEFDNEVLKRTYEEMLRDKALDNIMNYWKLFKSNHTVADQLYELKEMHPELEENYKVVNDLVLSQAMSKKHDDEGKLVESVSYKNVTLRDNRVSKDIFNVYHSNMEELMDRDAISVNISEENTEQDYIENKRVADFFNMLPFVGFLQSGLNTKDSLSIMRAMPTEGISAVIQETAKDLDINHGFLQNLYTKFIYHNRMANVSVRRRLKNYVTQDLSQLEPPKRNLMVVTGEAVTEEGDLIDTEFAVNPQDKKELEDLIKNNPNVIFVLENSAGLPRYGASRFEQFDNIMQLDLKGGKEALDESIAKIEAVMKDGATLAFLDKSIGYGENLTKINKESRKMEDQDMYNYLSAELFTKLNYENKYSKSVSEVRTLMQESQEVSDFDLEIPYEDMAEARERLNCNL